MTDPDHGSPEAAEQSEPDSADRPVLTTDEQAQTDDPVIDPGNS